MWRSIPTLEPHYVDFGSDLWFNSEVFGLD
jgi:hypothetical protein